MFLLFSVSCLPLGMSSVIYMIIILKKVYKKEVKEGGDMVINPVHLIIYLFINILFIYFGKRR